MFPVCSGASYRLKRSVAAVQLTGMPDGIPKLTYLTEGAIAHIKADGTITGFVEVLCGAQTYNVFLEDLQERAERADQPASSAVS
jgi:hypothetical protein